MGVRRASSSQSRINRFTLQRQHTKNALVNSAERFLMNESLQRFQSQCELAKGKRSFGAKTSALEPLQVFGQRVFRPVDDPKVFSSSYLNGGLHQPFPSLRHKLQRLYNHALAAACRQFFPPLDSFLVIRFVGEIHNSEWRREQQIRISVADFGSVSICHTWSCAVCTPDSL
jgi:hypothetical protein